MVSCNVFSTEIDIIRCLMATQNIPFLCKNVEYILVINIDFNESSVG